jgi:hypothetical protein
MEKVLQQTVVGVVFLPITINGWQQCKLQVQVLTSPAITIDDA